MQYSSEQQIIVFGSGNRLATARPGSGKTRVLAGHAIQYLVNSSGVLGAVSFTKDSSAELRGRILAGAGSINQSRLLTGTFHSLAGKQIRRLPEYRKLRIVGAGESQFFLRRAMEEVDCDLEFEDAVVQLDAMKSTPDPQMVADQRGMELLHAYNKLLRDGGCMDFADMIGLAVDGMRQGTIAPLPLDRLLVDEAQDIDGLQFEWVGLHTAAGAETLVVGDDDQCIYGWRSALGYDGMLKFVSDFGADHVQLSMNYRSGRKILELAEMVISKNLKRVDKPLRVGRDFEGTVTVRTASSREDEIMLIADAVADDPDSWGVLARTNSIFRLLEAELITRKIPFNKKGGKSVFEEGLGEIFCSILNSIHSGDSRGVMSALIYAGFNGGMFKRLGIKGDMPSIDAFRIGLERANQFSRDPSHIRTIHHLNGLWTQWSKSNNLGRYPGVIDAVRTWMTNYTSNTGDVALLEGCTRALNNARFQESGANLRDRVWALTGPKNTDSAKEGVLTCPPIFGPRAI